MLRISRPVLRVLHRPLRKNLGLAWQQGLSSSISHLCPFEGVSLSQYLLPSVPVLASGSVMQGPRVTGVSVLSTGTWRPDSATSGSVCVGRLRPWPLLQCCVYKVLPDHGRPRRRCSPLNLKLTDPIPSLLLGH